MQGDNRYFDMTAPEAMDAYQLRDEQEKYYQQMKIVLQVQLTRIYFASTASLSYLCRAE